MTPLTLTLRRRPAQEVDLGRLTPDGLQAMGRAAVEQIKLTCGNRSLRLHELFEVQGEDTSVIHIRRACDKLYGIGMAMSFGSISVQGRAGDDVGRNMRGGTIAVRGSAGHGTGRGMRGGYIEIQANTGDFLGGAEAGALEGMSEGVIIVSGDAGACVGDRMRRGIIYVRGKSGDYCGSRMKGGTILVLGQSGCYPGIGMRRGTIVFARKPAGISATFNSCGVLKMEFLRLLFRQLSNSYRKLALLRNIGPEAERFSGDLALGGKGELLVLHSALLEVVNQLSRPAPSTRSR